MFVKFLFIFFHLSACTPINKTQVEEKPIITLVAKKRLGKKSPVYDIEIRKDYSIIYRGFSNVQVKGEHTLKFEENYTKFLIQKIILLSESDETFKIKRDYAYVSVIKNGEERALKHSSPTIKNLLKRINFKLTKIHR